MIGRFIFYLVSIEKLKLFCKFGCMKNSSEPMWIKRNKELGESLHEKVNILYKENNIYVMDNHLCAAWCWLDSINVSKSYNFIHIDRHYDLLGFPNTIKTEIIDKNIELENLTFDEYQNLKQCRNAGEKWPVFRWDNYIINLNIVFPKLFKTTYFATQHDGTPKENFIHREVEFLDLFTEMDYWIEKDEGWIVNIDIDYFFSRIDEKLIQIYSNDAIGAFAKVIKKCMPNIDVLTIALSPECCGGWEESLRIMEIFSETLEISFSQQL